jgi:hypothetical protein
MTMKIFISYRRAETPHEAQRIRLQLEQSFGPQSVFIDRNIPPGKEFDKYLQTELSSCDAIVAVMGRDYFRIKQKPGAAVPEEPDYVRWEIETALQMGIPVFPILVRRGSMPREADLPEALRAYTKRQALHAIEPVFDAAIDQLIKELRTLEIVARHASDAVPESIHAPQNGIATQPRPVIGDTFVWRGMAILAAIVTLSYLAGLSIAGLTEERYGEVTDPRKLLLVGFMFLNTTASITFCPVWFFKLVNVVRARLRLNVVSVKAVIVTASASLVWIGNAIFLTLATNETFVFEVFGVRLPIWINIQWGLLVAIVVALLGIWEVAVGASPPDQRSTIAIFTLHVVNCVYQVALIGWMLVSASGVSEVSVHDLALYLTACSLGTVTFGISQAWYGFFRFDGRWPLLFLSASLMATCLAIAMSSFASSFARLIL